MSQPVKFASTPPSEYRNGLTDTEILRELIANPSDQRIGLVVFDVRRVETDVDLERQVPTVRLLRLELPLGLDQKAAWAMLERATKARVDEPDGVQQLPFGTDGRYEGND